MREACPVRCRAVTTLPPGGTVRPITRWGEPVMHRRLTLVTDFDRDLARLVADMCATMYAAEGVGLAAFGDDVCRPELRGHLLSRLVPRHRDDRARAEAPGG